MQINRRRILFVEDDDDTRDLIVLVLQRSDFEVVTASRITDTLMLAKRESFALFILDSRFPDGSGIDLCKEIRKFDQETPILFYSGSASEQDKISALNSGAQAYLVKPVPFLQLLQEISQLLTA